MSDAIATLEDLRKDIAEKERLLTTKQNRQLALMKSTKSATGERVVQPHEATEIRELEGQNIALTDQINALKLDYIELKTQADLERRSKEPFAGAAIHDGGGGAVERGMAGDAFTNQAAKTGLPGSLTERFVESPSYKSWIPGGQNQVCHLEIPAHGMRPYAMKATLLSSTGPFTSIDKQPSVVTLGQQEFTVADLMGQGQTDGPTIRYIREDTLTNAAAMVAEEGQKPEATWDLSEVDVTVRKIGVVTRVSDESFADWSQLRTYVDDRLPFMVRQREELQLISGDGTGQNLLGILNVPGILTQAKGSYSNIDAIYLAMTKVRTQGFWEPDAIVVHPTNWSPIRLLKTTTGEYVYGDPAVAGPETIFGKRVVITANMTANTAVVGAWKIGSTVFFRQGIRIEATNSDASDFQYNRIALRAEERLAPAWWRPTAFATVTGLDAA